MTEKSVFCMAWSSEMASQSFPVSCFWSRGFVLHRKWNLSLLVHQNTGKENRYRKKIAILISTSGRFNRVNEKKSVIYTLTLLNRKLYLLTTAFTKPRLNSQAITLYAHSQLVIGHSPSIAVLSHQSICAYETITFIGKTCLTSLDRRTGITWARVLYLLKGENTRKVGC